MVYNGRFFVTFCVPEERRLAQFLHIAFQQQNLEITHSLLFTPFSCKNCDKQNVASFSVFYLLKADRKKPKSAAWSDEERGAEHTKNSYVLLTEKTATDIESLLWL